MKDKNVLIICSDEHSRSAMGCSGHAVVRTPNLDRLAARGTRFNNAYTPSPICVSARACLATGTHVHQNRCWSSSQPYRGQHESWMKRLRDNGHPVVSIGKLHYRSAADDNGFSEEILPMYLANDGRGWPRGLIRNPLPGFEEAKEMAQGVGPGESDYTAYDRAITQTACDWLRERPKAPTAKPWALFVSYVSPHYPLIAPQEFYDLYADLALQDIAGGMAKPTHPVLQEMAGFWDYDDYFDAETRVQAIRAYFGLCSFLDSNIGQLLQTVDDVDLASDTVVLYLSDHGEMLGSHGFWGKSVMYEDSVGVPLILSGADVPVGVCSTPVSLVDIAATVEDLVGVESQSSSSDAWSGSSLLEFIDQPQPERYILSEYHDGGSPTGLFMIRRGDWKYVYYANHQPCQLFNVTADPEELNDLSESPAHRQVRDNLHQCLVSILDPEVVNAEAFAEQEALLESFGGRESVLAMAGFNHTPAPDS